MKKYIRDDKRAVVLLSGGIDSTTCLAMTCKEFQTENIFTISIFYGQRHARELKSARAIAKFYGVPHYELNAAEVFRFSNSSLLDSSKNPIEKSTYAEQIKKNHSSRISTCVPFRNGLMLSMAASFADSVCDVLTELFIGVHKDDATSNAYADCSETFISAMTEAIKIGTYGKILLRAPFVNKNKSDIIRLGLELNAPYHLTWSCYENGEIPCRQCATCIDRERAFEINGIKDPILLD